MPIRNLLAKLGTRAIDFGDGYRLWIDENGRLVYSGKDANGKDVHGDLPIPGDLSSLGGTAVVRFRTPAIDFTVPSSGSIILLPSLPGYYPESILAGAVWMTGGTGTATDGAVMQAGNNAAEDNVLASTTATAANINLCIAAGFPSRCQGLVGATTKQELNLITPVTLKITTPSAGSGGFTMPGYVSGVAVLAPL